MTLSQLFRKSTVRLLCAALFILFSFFWLYYFQADTIAVAQHGLSDGKTHYERGVGAVIITAVLYILHLLVYAVVRLSRRTHALTYLPSMMMLAFISSVSHPFSWGAWYWAGPLVLVLWGVTVWLARKMLPFSDDVKEDTGLFSRRSWLNMLQMAGMMLCVVAVSDTNAVNHFKAHAEVALQTARPEEATRVGERSMETDESLTMLRVFALSRQGLLGERLFTYPVSGSSLDMLPLQGSKSRLMLLADTVLWDYFGLRPDSIVARAEAQGSHLGIYGGQLNTRQYLDSLMTDTLATSAWQDYLLTGSLIDRRLDSFVVQLPRYYPLHADSLPRHYREALLLYQQRCDSTFTYADSLLLSEWQEFAAADTLYSRRSERIIRSDDHRHTYWYYYFYGKDVWK